MQVAFEFKATSIEVTSRGQTVKFDFAKVPTEKVAEFVEAATWHGLKQAIGDSAASATALSKEKDETRSAEEIALDLMTKKVKALESGEWTQRREATPKDPVKAEAFKEIRARLAQNAKFKAADKDGKSAIIEQVWNADEAKWRKEGERIIAQRKANAIDLDELLG